MPSNRLEVEEENAGECKRQRDEASTRADHAEGSSGRAMEVSCKHV